MNAAPLNALARGFGEKVRLDWINRGEEMWRSNERICNFALRNIIS